MIEQLKKITAQVDAADGVRLLTMVVAHQDAQLVELAALAKNLTEAVLELNTRLAYLETGGAPPASPLLSPPAAASSDAN